MSVHPFFVYHLVAALIEIRQTYVSFNQYSANRQSYNFSNPNSFIPERFLDEGKDERDDMSVFQPFQVGRHICLGLKVAYSEMRVVMARLLWSFDLQLADEEDRWDWGEQKTYILWVGVQLTCEKDDY